MAYRKSYYQQRTEEQARMRDAIEKQRLAQLAEAEAKAAEAEVVPEEPKPVLSWSKAAIQEWLDKNDIKYSRSMTKAKLLELID